jgi:hypothetical protein
MRWLLDTNAVLYFLDGRLAAPLPAVAGATTHLALNARRQIPPDRVPGAFGAAHFPRLAAQRNGSAVTS